MTADHLGEALVPVREAERSQARGRMDENARNLDDSLNVVYFDCREVRGTMRVDDTLLEED